MMQNGVCRKRRRLEGMDVFSAAVLTVFVLLIAFPFYTSLVTSFTTSTSYAQNPVQLIPQSFTWENYTYMWERLDIATGYKNTLFVVVFGTVFSMFISLTFAYGLHMRNYPGKKAAFLYLMITMYFGGGMIPTYMLMRDLGLINNPVSILLMCGVSPFNIVIIKNAFDGLPPSLSEVARVSGANEWQIFRHIALPLCMPTVVTFSLFIAVGYWNEWFWSMLLLTRPAVKTLQIMLRSIVTTVETMEMDSAASDYYEVFSQGLKMAAVIMTMLPIMVVYPFLQKYFAKGILIGAVKM